MRKVTVYTTEACGFCTRVKMLLSSHGVDFREENLAGKPDEVVALAEKTGMMTLPQVLVGSILIGGYHETAAAAASGMLTDLLAD
ncbi:MAG TPA: glutaredoxin domain-containing protein [Solirubrobacteraceae bacterium]|nr:glutaredoxin domain-containing protein [Solirubrobacteraceae bacterium]